MAMACASTATPGSRLIGCYVWGHEVNVISPIDQDSAFWVIGSPDVLQQLRMKHDSLTTTPYEAVVADLIAMRSVERGDGFALDYDGLIEVLNIVEMRRAESGECRSASSMSGGDATTRVSVFLAARQVVSRVFAGTISGLT
jgi:hypothetical protein